MDISINAPNPTVANSVLSTVATLPRVFIPEGGGLRLQSGPGRDLIFKVTGEDTAGAFDYFIIEVAPRGGPPLHIHHKQDETLHVVKGQFKVRVGDQVFRMGKGDFAYLPVNVPHAFLNLTDEPGELIATYVPGGGHHFYRELAPLARGEKRDQAAIAQVFAKHGMTLLGPPLSRD